MSNQEYLYFRSNFHYEILKRKNIYVRIQIFSKMHIFVTDSYFNNRYIYLKINKKFHTLSLLKNNRSQNVRKKKMRYSSVQNLECQFLSVIDF